MASQGEHMDTFLDVREGDFLLCVSGESMTGIGVMNGDHVLVRPTQEVHDGEVAVVLIPGENAATLKRLYRFGPEVTLISENPAYARMTYPADQVQVQGRAVTLKVERLADLPILHRNPRPAQQHGYG
jgi:repressor LexA